MPFRVCALSFLLFASLALVDAILPVRSWWFATADWNLSRSEDGWPAAQRTPICDVAISILESQREGGGMEPIILKENDGGQHSFFQRRRNNPF